MITKRLQTAITASVAAREAVNGLADDAPDDDRAAAVAKLAEADKELREASTAEPTEPERRAAEDRLEVDDPSALSAEDRERAEIRSRARLGGYVRAAANGKPVDGAEAEYAEAMGVPGQMPVTMVFGPPPRETRASATVAADAIAENPDPTAPQVFLSPLASSLGIMSPTVPPGVKAYPYISTGTSAAAVAKTKSPDDSSPAISALTVSAGRIAGRMQYQREDAAMLADLDSSLTANLQATLRDRFERQILAGDGAAPNLNGLLTQRKPAVPTDNTVTTFATLVDSVKDFVDGTYAESFEQVSLITSPTVASFLAALLLNAGNRQDSALDWLRSTYPGGLRISGHVPTIAQVNHGTAGDRRAGGGGLWAVRRRVSGLAYAPIWMGVDLVRDEITEAASGTVKVVAYMLAGGVAIVRPDVYTFATVKTVQGVNV